MTRPLAVLAPDAVGTPVATFIRRHMQELLPGGTVVIAPSAAPASAADWKIDCPWLDLNRIVGGRLRWQLAYAGLRPFGVRLDHAWIKRFFQTHGVRVILGEYLDFSVQWLDVAEQLGIPFFARAHGHDVAERLQEPEWPARYRRFNHSGGVIANSDATRRRLLAAGLDAAKVHLVYGGVDVPAQPLPRPPRDGIRCIAVGRMVSEKAPILLLDAFRRALERHPDLRLDLIGAGPLLPAAEQFLTAFDLSAKVRVLGELPNAQVLRLLAEADVFLQHSVREALGVSILEGMSRALPVVATRAGGIVETVVEGVTGYLVEPGDTAGMAERIVALARDPDLRRRMGAAGWQRAREMFTWEQERAGLLRVLGLSEA